MVSVRFMFSIKYSLVFLWFKKNSLLASSLVHELTSPWLDWPRVGLSANCPTNIMLFHSLSALQEKFTSMVISTLHQRDKHYQSALTKLTHLVTGWPLVAGLVLWIHMYIFRCHCHGSEICRSLVTNLLSVFCSLVVVSVRFRNRCAVNISWSFQFVVINSLILSFLWAFKCHKSCLKQL